MRVHKSMNSCPLLFAKDMIFRKQIFDVKQIDDEQIYKIYLAIGY